MKLCVLAVTMLFPLSSTLSQEGTWNLDRAHSSISFTVSHMVVSEVSGRFGDFSAAFTSSKDDFTDGTVEVHIKTASVNTDNGTRDNDLRSDQFFEAEKFPEIVFKSGSFVKGEGNKYKITGDLTIRDVTKKVTFDAEYTGSVKTMRGKVIAWKATTAINRFDYGVKWDKRLDMGGLVAGETVSIQVNLELWKKIERAG